MASKNAAKPATAASVNRLQDDQLGSAIVHTNNPGLKAKQASQFRGGGS
jgi:hypothetical protein